MSLFIIPMAGLSSRFFKAGYQKPKYQLQLGDKTVFEWSVSSFKAYFKTDRFLFIMRDCYQTPDFAKSMIEKMGITDATIVVLSNKTQGQADTVYQGLQHIDYQGDLIIFNIDSCRYNYQKTTWYDQCDGYLEVFNGIGEHWSFIEPAIDHIHVVRTTEKQKISNYCSNGIYIFKSRADFEKAFFCAQQSKKNNDELYIAPLYNQLIQAGKDIRYHLVTSDDIDFCGTPEEYQQIVQKKGAK